MKKHFIKYMAALLLFGSNGIVASHISLTSYEIVFFRTMIGSLLLLCLYLVSQRKLYFYHNKRDMKFLLLSGIAMGMSWMFLYEAYALIGVSVASLLYYTGPVIVIVLSPYLFQERITIVKMIGVVTVLVGIIGLNSNAIEENTNLFGIVCGLMSALMYSIMVIANKKTKNIKGMQNSLIQLMVSFFTVAVFIGIKNGFVFQVQSKDWIWILILGIVNTGIGCYLYFSSIGQLSVQTVAICGYLEPLSAVVFSVLILQESLMPIQVIGAICIIGGAVLSER